MTVYGIFQTIGIGWNLLALFENKDRAITRAEILAKAICSGSNKNYRILDSSDKDSNYYIEIYWNNWYNTRSGDQRHKGTCETLKVVELEVQK